MQYYRHQNKTSIYYPINIEITVSVLKINNYHSHCHLGHSRHEEFSFSRGNEMAPEVLQVGPGVKDG